MLCAVKLILSRVLQGQTALDVADSDMVKVLEELRKKQSTMPKDKGEIIMNRKHNQRYQTRAEA